MKIKLCHGWFLNFRIPIYQIKKEIQDGCHGCCVISSSFATFIWICLGFYLVVCYCETSVSSKKQSITMKTRSKVVRKLTTVSQTNAGKLTNVCRGCLATERKMVSATPFKTVFKDLAGISVSQFYYYIYNYY